MQETLLCFDFGEKRIGVAVGNTFLKEARPLCIVRSETKVARWSGIEKLVEDWSPDAFVVGLPRHPDGTPHKMTTLCERFARQLQGRYHLPVYFVDERYSSAVVDSDATWIDDEAAAVILQQYFDETSQKDQ